MHHFTTLSAIEQYSLELFEWKRKIQKIKNSKNHFKGRHIHDSINDKVNSCHYTVGLGGRVAHNKSTMFWASVGRL